jgi:acetolactate synthase-1/2/3 large subunit|tara:strand:+ start:2511 stop:4313 length:1803 start_codon:yes stop_codon:yes gene_type:complete
MNLSDYVLKFLISKKIKNVFLITGGAICFLIDAFSRTKKIKYTCVAHEQAAAMMADAYSRLGPNLSCTMATSGPGATNLITGIACSWFDSIPSIHITGQVNSYEQQGAQKGTKNVRQIGFQETDIVSITKPITKFSYKLKNEKEIKYILEKACYLAQSGRPGPVVIDLPMDFQRKKINPSKLKSFKFPKRKNKKKPLIKYIKKINSLIKKSKRPVILLGGGIKVSKSEKKLDKFLKNFNIPIVTTWSGVDLIDHDNNKYIGNVGVYGNRAANFAVQNSDLLLCLGSRLDTRITGGVPKTFARKSKVISIDIDKNELSKQRGLKLFLKVNSDLSDFFDVYNKNFLKFKFNSDNWHKKCLNWKNKYPSVKKEYFAQSRYVNPYVLINVLSKYLKKNSTIIADDGGHLTWAIQAFKVKKGQRLFSAFGNSPMGYALPASIGASIVKNKAKVICIDGDGSIQINIQELHTISSNNLPIKIIVMNNNGYGIIKQFQDLYLNKRYEATVPRKGVTNPNFKKISEGYGICYSIIKNNGNLKKILRKALKSNRPEFIEVILKPDQKIIPKLQFGNPIEDLSPLLPRNEFKKNMQVSTVKRNKAIFEAN